jgi:outer membrane receptor protein involved in Fe transport
MNMKNRVLRALAGMSMVSMTALIAATGTPAHGQSEVQRDFNIPAQPLAAAIIEYSRQSDAVVTAPARLTRGKTASAVRGNYTSREALKALLAGTGLTVQAGASGGMVIVAASVVPNADGGDGPEIALRDILVTGSRIRGTSPASPVHTITRKDIERSGYGQIGDVIRSLPENFSGGQNPGIIGARATDDAQTNTSNASTVNLRGLGSGSTLVLVNGHRLTGDTSGYGSDISGIPLAAIERVEIVADGASALYGSDAIAGVANFILRKDFNGGEVSARIGGATEGGGFEQTYSGLAGISRDNWHALINYEHSSQDPIKASQRDFTSTATPVTDLIRQSVRNSLYIGLGGDITQHVSLSLDALLSDRDVGPFSQKARPTSTQYNYVVDNPSYNIAPSIDIRLPGDWKLNLTGVVARTENDQLYKTVTAASHLYFDNQVRYAEAAFNGVAFHLPSGDVRTAFGGGYRDESYTFTVDNTKGVFANNQHATRSIRYAFGEVLVPLVSASDTRWGLNKLELSIAGRFEKYSDFGSTFNPKIGLHYVPVPGLSVRGSWGTSFKAPTLDQASTSAYLGYNNAPTLGGPSGEYALYVTGGNEDLQPEESKSWTIGFDFSPPHDRTFSMSATYFNVEYTNRIAAPILSGSLSLSSPDFAPFVVRSPGTDYLNHILGLGPVTNNSDRPFAPGDVAAVVDDRLTNVAAQSAQGIDFSIKKSFEIDAGELSVFANASWLDSTRKTLATTPEFALSGTIFNPSKYRARGGLTWTNDGLSAGAITNYSSGSTDTGVIPNQDIDAWTTVDATIAYRFQQTDGWLSGVRIAVSASNIFNQAPPFAASPSLAYRGIYFDSATASAIGRFVSLQIARAW